MDREKRSVIVVGAGIGGICAALAAARNGAEVLLLEADDEVGGTGVHSPVGLVCQFFDSTGRAVIEGLHRELFPKAYEWTGRFEADDIVPNYDERELLATYKRLLAAEENLRVLTGTEVTAAETSERPDGRRRIERVGTADGRCFAGEVFIDATANGDLSALAGAEFRKGRDSDGLLQTVTLTFKISGIDPGKLRQPDIRTWRGIRSLRAELTDLYREMKDCGGTDNLRTDVLCFPYNDGRSILLNSTAVAGIDPTVPASVAEGEAVARKQVSELAEAVLRHPAFARAEVEFVSRKLGVREGRRIVGDYVLTVKDVLGEARFDDMVAACAYGVDIHDPEGGKAHRGEVGGTGYYHIPYRSLRAKGFATLLLGSRCISGTHEAMSSYRVMCSVSAIGQAAGAAASLIARRGIADARDVDPAEIQSLLGKQGQFVEGPPTCLGSGPA